MGQYHTLLHALSDSINKINDIKINYEVYLGTSHGRTTSFLKNIERLSTNQFDVTITNANLYNSSGIYNNPDVEDILFNLFSSTLNEIDSRINVFEQSAHKHGTLSFLCSVV